LSDTRPVTIFTLRDLRKVTGSSIRPLWQAAGLRANGFNDFQLDYGKLTHRGRLVHAHQDAIYHTDGLRYLADLHGVTWTYWRDGINRLALSPRKLHAKYIKVPRIKKREEGAYRRAEALVCAGTNVAAEVAHLNKVEIVRNAVDPSKYAPTNCHSLRVAVCGPFAADFDTKYTVPLLTQILKLDRKTEFTIIGEVEQQYKTILQAFENVTMLGWVDNFIDTLRSCSVLLAAYPPNIGCGSTKCKLLDAAACSLAIVATTAGGIDFDDEAFLHGETAQQLVDQIGYLSSESARMEYGKKSRDEVERSHDYIKESRKLIDIYERYLTR